jgi:hypothetical protein
MIERPEVDDGSREELAEYYKEQQSDTLCRTCGNTDCPIDDKRATQCVEYYPLNPTEDACPKPTTTTT